MLSRSTETHNQIDSLREQLRYDERFTVLESLEVQYKQYLYNLQVKPSTSWIFSVLFLNCNAAVLQYYQFGVGSTFTF